MLTIVALILLLAASVRIFIGLVAEKAVLHEFGSSLGVVWWALLFPLGPLIFIWLRTEIGWVWAAATATVCYFSALIAARPVGRLLDASGTARTDEALSLVKQAMGTAIFGLAYITLALLWHLLIGTATLTS